eukprot:1989066-Rhodomonas_salina.1
MDMYDQQLEIAREREDRGRACAGSGRPLPGPRPLPLPQLEPRHPLRAAAPSSDPASSSSSSGCAQRLSAGARGRAKRAGGSCRASAEQGVRASGGRVCLRGRAARCLGGQRAGEAGAHRRARDGPGARGGGG